MTIDLCTPGVVALKAPLSKRDLSVIGCMTKQTAQRHLGAIECAIVAHLRLTLRHQAR